jgi:putative ABC transport system permease protein
VFYLNYIFSELRRRKSRTILTALGLGVGVAFVVAINALSNGLSDAQATVLKPLTGLGTDMTVTRPLNISANGSGNPFQNLTPAQRRQLQQEGGGGLGLQNLGKAGSNFTRTTFRVRGDLTFPASDVATVRTMSGVAGAAGELNVNVTTISGTVPSSSGSSGGGPGPFGGGGGPNSINLKSIAVTGVDQTQSNLAGVTPSQVTSGTWFPSTGGAHDAIISTSYANTNNIAVGDTVSLDGTAFKVIGISKAPLGGSSSDVYVELPTLQSMAGQTGNINGMQVRATQASAVASVSKEITTTIQGAQVTTASDLANRVGGSLKDAKNLTSTLGTALEIVALIAAVLIACLLTLSALSKRVREIGTLKAIGWRQWIVVRQIGGESLAQGVLGGVIGAIIGVVAAAVISSWGITLNASVASTTSNAAAPAGGSPGGGGPFGFGRVASSAASQAVSLSAPVSISLILLAILLAVVGGLIAGAVGGLRAARMRPADALRNVD